MEKPYRRNRMKGMEEAIFTRQTVRLNANQRAMGGVCPLSKYTDTQSSNDRSHNTTNQQPRLTWAHLRDLRPEDHPENEHKLRFTTGELHRPSLNCIHLLKSTIPRIRRTEDADRPSVHPRRKRPVHPRSTPRLDYTPNKDNHQ